MEASAASAEATDRANELYWGSDRSVNQIAEELDLSKGALYGMIQPLAVGRACPLCGSEVQFSNRTAKERGRLDCPVCEWDGTSDEAAELEDGEAEALERSLDKPSRVVAMQESNMRVIAGGALLGAAAGLALVMWARRR